MNPYTGDMPLDVNGERLTLAFTWAALGRVRAELGADGQAAALAGDLDKLAALLAIGLARHNPDWTAARVAEASPPVFVAVKAAEAALAAAYFGPSGVPEGTAGNPRTPPPTLWNGLWRRLFGRG